MESNESLSDLLNQHFLEAIRIEITKANEAAAKAQQRAVELAAFAQELEHHRVNLDNVPFSVHIYDPWDSAVSSGQEKSCEATKRGLANALRAAEGQYAGPHGKPRTDGVLSYYVTAMLPSGDMKVPDEIWIPYSQQTAESVAKSRKHY